MNFDEMILDAAKCITAATQALLQAASAAQRELNAIYGSSSKPAFHSELDGQWSNGLISAARHVAAATHCKFAFTLVTKLSLTDEFL